MSFPGGVSGMSGIERVFKKILEVTERFEAIQAQVKDVRASAEHPRQTDSSFRSALQRAQERQPTDGKTEYPEPRASGVKPIASDIPNSAESRQSGGSDASMEKRLMDTLRRELPKYNVPPDLALAVMKAESNFNPMAKSPKGAIGLMQIMPKTAASLGVDNENDLYQPEVNIPTGLQYMSNLLKKYGGNEKLALAAYNAGPGAVDRHGGVPPFSETQDYLKRVFDIRRRLNDIEAGS